MASIRFTILEKIQMRQALRSSLPKHEFSNSADREFSKGDFRFIVPMVVDQA